MKIMNIPEYAAEHNWIVARPVDDEVWFYGAYNDENRARSVAEEINGIVIHK